MRTHPLILIALTALLALGCSDRTGPSVGPPAGVVAVGDHPEQGVVGETFEDSLRVLVSDEGGTPVEGVAVRWNVTSGDGMIGPDSAVTDAEGEAAAAWTLGTAAGNNTATAAVEGLGPVEFRAAAAAAEPDQLVLVGGDAQEALTGEGLGDPLTVRVTDRFENPASGVRVTWGVRRGGGQVNPADGVTDDDGVSSASWQLGDSIGAQAAFAEVDGAELRAEFAANAEPVDPPLADTVSLLPGMTIGEPVFPDGNTEDGGRGESIGGIGCIDGHIAYHVHAQLSLFVNGEQLAIPAAVGIVDPVYDEDRGLAVGGSCLYWIHTHDETGMLHIEPPNDDDVLTLGQFFDVWGQPLSGSEVAGYEGPVTVYVDGERYRDDVRDISLTSHKHIAVYVGTPLAPIPQYDIPYSR